MPVLKGGHEILGLVPGPREHVELEIKCFLSPPAVLVEPEASAHPPYWLTSAVKLNKIPVAIEGSRLKIWECYKCKTGTTNWTTYIPPNPTALYNGPSGSAWAVSGMPMSMLPVVNAAQSTEGATPLVPPLSNDTQPVALNSNATETIAQYVFNPWVENAKYFMKASVGSVPASFGDNNSTTVLLTDEQGWGIMCPNQEVFITACDFASEGAAGTGSFRTFCFPRYFTLYFRQRYVKSPVVLSDIFQDYALKQVAGYKGETENVMEVELVTGRDPNAPEGMLDSDGVRNPVPTTGGAGASMFSKPALFSKDVPLKKRQTQTLRESVITHFINKDCRHGATNASPAAQEAPQRDPLQRPPLHP
nr:MAG: VP1 [Bat polyomavirus]